MNSEILKNLGPLATLLGTWEGDKGADIAPSDDRQIENNQFRERINFESCGQVNNHEQILYGLRYSKTAWRLGINEPFHEELGYWLWDAAAQQIVFCFMVPRGVTAIAGGTVKADAQVFSLAADAGSETYGICSNQFLEREFKTVRYEIKISIHDQQSFSYEADTHLKMKGRPEVFHHTDRNLLKRIQ